NRRLGALVQSREYSILVAHNLIDGSYSSLQTLSGQPTIGMQEQVLLWAQTISNLTQDSLWDAVNRLVELGILDKKIVDESSKRPSPEDFLKIYSNMAMTGIVIPFLANDLPN